MELTQEQTKELFEKLKGTLKLYNIENVEIKDYPLDELQMVIVYKSNTYFVNRAYIKGFSLVFEMFDSYTDDTALYGAENLIKHILNIL